VESIGRSSVPKFLRKYFDNGEIVGVKDGFIGSFPTKTFYVRGHHPQLVEFALVQTRNSDLSGSPETEVTVYNF
jgi:hypothetical protein